MVDKCQDLQSEAATRRPRRAGSRLKPGGTCDAVSKSRCFSSSAKAGKNQHLSVKAVRQEEFSLVGEGQLFCSVQAFN